MQGSWYGVRSLIQMKANEAIDGYVYEERIVCFQADSEDILLEKAELEVSSYVEINGFINYHSQFSFYLQDGDALIDGYELWSILYASNLPLDAFYEEKYIKDLHLPE